MTPRLLDAGDAAITVEFGAAVDAGLLAQVLALDRAIAALLETGALPGLIETMPTFRSLTIFFDPLVTGRRALIDALQPLFDGSADAAAPASRHWRLPVCYEGDAGADLEDTARALGLGADEVVALHSGTDFRVYMLGFLPGFPFLGDLPEALRRPRRREPRVRVPPGSVAIAGALSAIYPWQSPGGWHLLGRCPVPLFDPKWPSPALLRVGDAVCFEPVPTAEYERLAAAVEGGEISTDTWRAAGVRR